MAFGTWLVDKLAEERMTRTEFIEQLGVGKTTVSQWINEKSDPSVRNVLDIARVLRVPPDEVLYAILGTAQQDQRRVAPVSLPPALTLGEAQLIERLAWSVRQWREAIEPSQQASGDDTA